MSITTDVRGQSHVITDDHLLSLISQRCVKTAVKTEAGVWLQTDVCVPTASPAPSVNEVTAAVPHGSLLLSF